jgi:putative chitinase
MTPAELLHIMPNAGQRAQIYAQPLTDAMREFEISSPARRAAFLAQICHESGSLRYVEEIASGDAYETRTDLGNTPQVDGDGRRYKGRGLLQVTGRANYAACGIALNINLVEEPQLLTTPVNACRSAGWFWQSRGCSELADQDLFGALTKRINGGYTGLDDRIQHWLRARRVLGI